MAEITNKLNIFLIKSEFSEFSDIVDSASCYPIGENAAFYTENSYSREPDWVKDFFGNSFDNMENPFHLRTSSAKGVFVIKVLIGESTRIFAIVFGHGRFLLNLEAIEDRFGLKIVLNSVDPKSIRSLDKTTLGSNPKQSREQISRESEASSFGIDVEQDLINSITGKSLDQRLGKNISGRDALSVSVKVDINNISEFLQICFEQYNSIAYKQNFDWIDQIKDIRNPRSIATLNDKLIIQLNDKDFSKVWMAAPEVIDWVDIKGFRYSKSHKAELQPDLEIEKFITSFGEVNITVDLLKKSYIYFISAGSDEATKDWTSYSCIYAEIEHNGTTCILNNGKWFEISSDFTTKVIEDFSSTPDSTIELPVYTHLNEGVYNESLPSIIANSCCMDRKNITHGGGHSSVEFCDLLTSDKKLVHIKMYSGSSQLSHLFAQGVVSGELFLQDENFRRKLNEKLPDSHKLPDITVRPNPAEHEVIFAVISKSANPLDIPFFSKVSLRNARRRLSGYGYKVTKKKIVKQAT